MLDLKQGLIVKSNQLLSGRALEGCVLYAPLWHGKLQGSPFPSLDWYHHSCTVTGALWTPQGRTFDVDDNIRIPTAAVFDTKTFTIDIWAKWSSVLGTQCLITKGGAVGNGDNWHLLKTELDFYFGIWNLDGAALPFPSIDIWYHYNVVVTQPAAVAHLTTYQNGELFLDTDSNGTIDDVSDTDLYLGTWFNGASYPLSGTMGEAKRINRALTPSEILNNHLATKWRYQ